VCLGAPYGEWTDRRSDWVLERLWRQRGALLFAEAGTMFEAIRVQTFLGAGGAIPRVRIGRTKAALSTRLSALAARLDVVARAADDSFAPRLDIAADGAASLSHGRRRLALPDPERTLRALGALGSRRLAAAPPAEPAIAIDRAIVDLIVKPPHRILSEVASKRLLEAYGIALPQERLCGSPTEAARFAAELGATAVLKLVRPALRDKHRAGAVLLAVSGAANVRRAHNELLRRGRALGPPPPLGVLVCREITGGARVWLARELHPELGPLVIGGPGDRPGTPELAVRAPCTIAEARRALEDAVVVAVGREQLDALAVALARFSRLVADLGTRIGAAEIHPLVALDAGPAIALDALIAIAD
jgi:hypothetical protein